MKKILLFAAVIATSLSLSAQGKSGQKSTGNGKTKQKTEKHNDDSPGTDIFNNPAPTTEGGGAASHQPKKVTAALLRDYPAASNVVWSKYKGDYTATFRNGIFTSTAVYHANGARRDTRTPLTRDQLPGTIWDRIFRRDNFTPTDIVQIERPSTAQKIFRILNAGNTPVYYNAAGNLVDYAW